jgi:hypothetical protein
MPRGSKSRAFCGAYGRIAPLLMSLFVLEGAAYAQNLSTNSSNSAPLTTPYVDRLLTESGSQDTSLDDNRTTDRNGWPRSIRIELQWAQSRSNNVTTSGTGLALRSTLDTPNYGSFSVDGQIGTSQRATNASPGNTRTTAFTLTQLGMPLANGWSMNNALGIVAPTQISLARQQPRIGLPSRALEGATTEFLSPNGITLNASAGRIGQLDGYPSASFRPTDGNYASAGGQFRLPLGNGVSTTAINTTFVRGARDELGLFANSDITTKSDFNGLFVAQRFQQGELALQGNAIRSSGTTNVGNAKENTSGYWFDATLEQQRTRHSGGLFYLDPGLNWGGLAMNNDVQGGYYRFAYQTLRLSTDLSVEALRPVRGTAASGAFASGTLRYQLSRDVSVGGGATLREFDGRGWQTYGYLQSKNRLGTGRTQLDVTENTTGERSQSIAFDQTFHEQDGLRLSTTLSLSNQTSATVKRRVVSLSIAGGAEIFDNVTLDGNVQSRATISGPKDDALFLTLGLTSRFARDWSLSGNAIIGRGRYDTGIILDPLAPPSLVTTRPNQRSFLVTLRYEDRAGTIVAPIGGRVGSGGAEVSGIIFLDANTNGIADANEAGAANLFVLLDGRFSARTDAQGHFSFPFVGAGTHTLSVVTDNLPLPWLMNNDGLTRINVMPRETLRVNIGATKSP